MLVKLTVDKLLDFIKILLFFSRMSDNAFAFGILRCNFHLIKNTHAGR